MFLSFGRLADKEIKNKAEAEKIKHPVMKKAIAEYIRLAERAVTNVPTSHIVERTVSSMSLIGWKYTGLLPFIEAFEIGILGIGFVLAIVYGEHSAVYGLLAVITFVALRISAAFFNVREVRAQFSDELVLYIEREIGRYFAADTGAALLRLKNDLTEAIDRQSVAYKSTMEFISGKMDSTFTQVSLSMVGAANSIGPIVAKSMDEKLLNMNDSITKILNEWEDALKQSAETQNAINSGAERFSKSAERVQSASDLLATQMKGYNSALSEQLITLVSAIDEMKACIKTLSEGQKSLTAQSAFIERNQKALEDSLNSYEASLQSLTRSIGDGLGAFINLHAQTSAQTINDAMRNNIEKIMNLNMKS
jgi:uncharacterized protein YoxC